MERLGDDVTLMTLSRGPWFHSSCSTLKLAKSVPSPSLIADDQGSPALVAYIDVSMLCEDFT